MDLLCDNAMVNVQSQGWKFYLEGKMVDKISEKNTGFTAVMCFFWKGWSRVSSWFVLLCLWASQDDSWLHKWGMLKKIEFEHALIFANFMMFRLILE